MADSFDADWLSLREGVDAGSRSRPLAEAFLAAIDDNDDVQNVYVGLVG